MCKLSLSTMFAVSLCIASGVSAAPVLQLDIDGGSYVGGNEDSTVTTADVFKVYALLTPKHNDNLAALLADTYYLSIALTPALASYAGSDSIVVNGATKAISTFTYGRPPIETMDDNGDLSPHGIFDTLYLEHAFTFTAADRTATYNVEDVGGIHVAPVFVAGGGTYYVGISIDRTLLSPTRQLHFDLYSTSPNMSKGKNSLPTGGESIKDFAPFSHDAQTEPCTSDCGTSEKATVPEPASLLLLGTGLLMIARRVSRRG